MSRTHLVILASAVLVALILLAGGWGILVYMDDSKDDRAYAAAQTGGDIRHYQAYLTQYPLGRHVREADWAIEDLEWQAVPKSLSGYMDYLKSKPTGRHAKEARTKADDLAGLTYTGEGNVSGLRQYLEIFPQGRKASEAKTAIEELEWQAVPKNVSGYIAYLKSYPNGRHAEEARIQADDLAWSDYAGKGNVSGLRQYLEIFPEGMKADEAREGIERKLRCNRAYAEKELMEVAKLGGVVEAKSDGASNQFSTRQGRAYSNTYFNSGSMTTYYHDGSYTSQEGVEVRYHINNNSRFLVFNSVEGTASFRTRAGAIAKGLLGAWLGGAALAAQGKSTDEALVGGAKKGYDWARHSQKIVITEAIQPGHSYAGRVSMKAKYKVLNSEFKAERIRAVISEPLLEQTTAPGC